MDVDIYYKQLRSMNPRQLLTQLFAFGKEKKKEGKRKSSCF